MKKRDWLLQVIGDRMEPIQLQKALFKFSQESEAPKWELYAFEPYNWGPCSFEIYEDLSALRENGLVEFEPSGRGWNVYRLTDAGKLQASKLKKRADPGLLNKLVEIREYVVTRSFSNLLSDVYKQYPGYAANSLFRG